MRATMQGIALTVVVATAVAGGVDARALEAGQKCTLKAPLTVTIHRRAGTLEDTLDKGTNVELISVGDGDIARINAGEIKANVAMSDLESACRGTLRACTLGKPVLMYEQPRSDSRSWRVKVGADVSVLKKGKTWAAVRVGDLQGFVKADEINGACAAGDDDSANDAALSDSPGDGDAGVVDVFERGEGPGVLVLPFVLEGAAPAVTADTLFETLYERTAHYRPDAARAPSSPRELDLKQQLKDAAQRATRGDLAYAIIGRLALEAPSKEAPLAQRYLLETAIVDAKTAKVLKGVRLRPTTNVRDPWAEKVLAALLPAIASAPGSSIPTIAPAFEVAANPGGVTAAADRPLTPAAASDDARAPWFANVWGYLALTGAVAAGVGSGFVGNLALDENDRANLAVQTDPTRGDHRNTALAEAIAADSLGVVAAGALVGTIVVFATRAGLEP